MWKKTFSTTNSGGKIWRRKMNPSKSTSAKSKAGTNRKHAYIKLSKLIKSRQRRGQNWNWHWNQFSNWAILNSDSVTMLKVIEKLKPRHFWQLLFPEIYWHWTLFAILAISICRHSRQKWFTSPNISLLYLDFLSSLAKRESKNCWPLAVVVQKRHEIDEERIKAKIYRHSVDFSSLKTMWSYCHVNYSTWKNLKDILYIWSSKRKCFILCALIILCVIIILEESL